MNNQTVYWIWMQCALGYSNKKIIEIAGKYSFAEDFYYNVKNGCINRSILRKNDLDKLLNTSLEQASKLLSQCEKSGIDIISYGDPSYPEKLRSIPNPPLALYLKGDKNVLSNKYSVAIVGPRNPDDYGLKQTGVLSYNLAKSGFTIISGGALGVDTQAHKEALNADGVTICVLGCGIDHNYLKQNDYLKNRIIEKGALVSEYPPNEPPTKHSFPQRNRIISALAQGVIVVEAAEKSGALITADLAKSQGRDVFAVPGNIDSEMSVGTNNLIKQGAVMITSYLDVLKCYNVNVLTEKSIDVVVNPIESLQGTIFKTEPVESNKNIPVTKTSFYQEEVSKKESSQNTKDKKEKTVLSDEQLSKLSESLKILLKAFIKPKMHIDELVESSNMNVSEINSALTELELYDYVQSEGAKEYSILVSIK